MVKWKGIDLNTKGIVVEKTPTISKGKKNIETYTIDGRNGFLTIDRGTYQSFTVSVQCHAKETADFDEIKAFLDGYGTISIDGQREYTGIINNSIPFEKVANFKSFLIQFLVNPIAHDITPTVQTITSSPASFEITGATAEIEPIIELEATGDVEITINNKTFQLSELESGRTYTLNSEAKEIQDDNNLNVANKMSGDFPTLKAGTNNINYTGSITEFKITYKKAYL